ncbi:helix-turn-helix domain-containing protein [Marinobacterium rhizophilum]|uniref:helix-turn-helix domain-containing protein n=1 Tax=Marinobacterium rhizophilum TaxID=420402 RepID=UPI00039B6303|nr:helix-turn-helix transcriptional regulator [Marinobacterium rhizophilum]
MRQTKALIDTLKAELRAHNKTYAEVAPVLGLSQASVKRLFSTGNLSLHRLERLCEFLNLEFGDLIRSMERRLNLTSSLTLETEAALVSNIRLLLMAHFLISGLDVDTIIDRYAISPLESIRLLAQLDRMKIIELLPGNRVRVRLSPQFRWQPGGPIERFYEQGIQSEFLHASFNGAGEQRLFVSGMLSAESSATLVAKLKRLAAEFDELSREDTRRPLEQRSGTSLIMAIRAWEPKAFARLRRQQ